MYILRGGRKMVPSCKSCLVRQLGQKAAMKINNFPISETKITSILSCSQMSTSLQQAIIQWISLDYLGWESGYQSWGKDVSRLSDAQDWGRGRGWCAQAPGMRRVGGWLDLMQRVQHTAQCTVIRTQLRLTPPGQMPHGAAVQAPALTWWRQLRQGGGSGH